MNPTGDLLYGVPAIAKFLKMSAKQVYHLHDQGNLPTFKIGVNPRRLTTSLSARSRRRRSITGGKRAWRWASKTTISRATL